jgi:PAS domain S-box-containing protein
MLSIPPPPSSSRPHPKWGIVLAYGICPLMLAVSAYGFWQWFVRVPTMNHIIAPEELFYLISLVIIPLVLFLFLWVTASQRVEHNRASVGYQMRIDQLQARLNAQEEFVRTITDSNPEAISIFDKDNRYWFVNLSAARQLGRETSDIIKKPLEKIVGYERAQKIGKRLNEVRTYRHSVEALDPIKGEQGLMRYIQAHYEPIAPLGDFNGNVMLREEDVTGLIVERERRANMLRQVIGTLVAVVDRRDPYAAGHSARVGQLSRLIAEELLLSETEIDAAEIAGSLMNFGKVLVPRELLTKATALTAEELQRVRESILTSADILSIIDFDGPVVATLRQVLERVDGSGTPEGLKGDAILITARIVTVANAYVALVSPRAHRPSLPLRDALERVLSDVGKLYDRRVVDALSNCVKNRRDLLDWVGAVKQA